MKLSKLLLTTFLTLSLPIGSLLADYKPLSEFSTHPDNIGKRKLRHEGIKIYENKHIKVNKISQLSDLKTIKPFVLNRVIIENNDNLNDDLSFAYNPFLNKQVTPKELNEIKKSISNFYISKGYLLPRPQIMEENINNGVLKIILTLDSVSNVVIIGEGENNNLIRSYAQKIIQIKPANTKEIQHYLGLMNEVSGFNAHYSLRQEHPIHERANENPIDLVVSTSKEKGKALLNVDNYGVKELGKYQPSALIEFFSPFKMNETITLHAGTTDRLKRFNNASLGYHMPINSYGTSAGIYTSYTKDNPTYSYPIRAADNDSTSVTFNVHHPIFLTMKKSLRVEAGIDYRKSKSYTNLNNKSEKFTNTKLTTGFMGAKLKIQDKFKAENLIHVMYYNGLSGKLVNYIDPKDVAKKHFKVFNVDYFRDQDLANNFSYFGHIAWQQSSDKLPNSEKFVLGGRDFGRAYNFSEIALNKGLGFSLEARYSHELNHQLLSHAQPYIFYDIGFLNKNYKGEKIANISSLSSVGPGVRFRFVNNYEAGAEIAVPLKKNFVVDAEKIKAKTKFNFFVSKSFQF